MATKTPAVSQLVVEWADLYGYTPVSAIVTSIVTLVPWFLILFPARCSVPPSDGPAGS